MTINISEELCEKNGIKIEELLAILLVKHTDDIPKLFKEMESKQMIVKDMFNNYLITQRWDDVVSTTLLDSDKFMPKTDKVEELALKLMSIFPKEKKQGTCHYFRGNKKENTLRLKKFFKLFGDKYSEEQIVKAATKYVESFNGQYDYMRILKYFIWKEVKRIDSEGKGYVEEVSDLASYIENEGQEDSLGNDWTSELR
jgi:transcriptional regulator of heat shock response